MCEQFASNIPIWPELARNATRRRSRYITLTGPRASSRSVQKKLHPAGADGNAAGEKRNEDCGEAIKQG